VFEPEAVCSEETNRHLDNELRMRVRVITQTFNDLWQHRSMLNPLRSGFFAFELFSHKVMRYLVPLFLVTALIASAVLAWESPLYRIVLLLQLACYVSAVIAFALERLGFSTRLLALPQYFVLTNVASVMALFQLLRGETYTRWEPIREPARPET